MSSTTTKWILELVDRVNKPMRTIQQAGLRAEKQTNSVDRALSRLKKNAITAFGAFQLWEGFKGIVNLGLDAEKTDVKFGVLLGSANKATKMLADIDKFANKTPFENADLKKSAEQLLNFGINGQKILPTLKMLGDVSGGNKDRLNSLSLAYAQVQSTGKLMGQDLLQMINAGFNPLEVISRKTGKSIGFLKDQMSKGNISALQVEQAFKLATSSGGRYDGMLNKISETTGGKMSTFFGSLKTKIANFSKENILPVVGKIFDIGTKVVSNFSIVSDAIFNLLKPLKPVWLSLTTLIGLIIGVSEEGVTTGGVLNTLADIINIASIPIEIMANGVSTLLDFLQPLAPVLKVLAIAYGVWTVAQWAINIAMTANPIGIIIVGITALIGVIVTAYKKVGWFRGAVDATWVSIKGFGKMIKTLVIDHIKNMISGITGIGEALMHFFNGEWSKAWEVGKKATKDLIGITTAQKIPGQLEKIGKESVKAFNKGVNSVEAVKIKTKTEGETETNAGVIPKLDDFLGDTPALKKDTINVGGKSFNGGGSGGSKSITQNVTVQNIFKVDKDSLPKIDEYAEKIAGKLNDMLRDGMIALE